MWENREDCKWIWQDLIGSCGSEETLARQLCLLVSRDKAIRASWAEWEHAPIDKPAAMGPVHIPFIKLQCLRLAPPRVVGITKERNNSNNIATDFCLNVPLPTTSSQGKTSKGRIRTLLICSSSSFLSYSQNSQISQYQSWCNPSFCPLLSYTCNKVLVQLKVLDM